jgi:hypothetical protein
MRGDFGAFPRFFAPNILGGNTGFQGQRVFHIKYDNFPEGLRRAGGGYIVPAMPDFIPSSDPDFRQMTPAQLREGITTLNFLVRDLKRFQASGDTAHLALWREGTKEAARAAAVLPSAGLVTRLADMPDPIDERGAYLLGRGLVSEAEVLRKKYKGVWRGRPRDSFRDVSARMKRKPKGWTFGR